MTPRSITLTFIQNIAYLDFIATVGIRVSQTHPFLLHFTPLQHNMKKSRCVCETLTMPPASTKSKQEAQRATYSAPEYNVPHLLPHLGFLIGPKNTNLVEDIEILLSIDFHQMNANKLKMNTSKTEFIIFGSRKQLDKCSTNVININGDEIDSEHCINI